MKISVEKLCETLRLVDSININRRSTHDILIAYLQVNRVIRGMLDGSERMG